MTLIFDRPFLEEEEEKQAIDFLSHLIRDRLLYDVKVSVLKKYIRLVAEAHNNEPMKRLFKDSNQITIPIMTEGTNDNFEIERIGLKISVMDRLSNLSMILHDEIFPINQTENARSGVYRERGFITKETFRKEFLASFFNRKKEGKLYAQVPFFKEGGKTLKQQKKEPFYRFIKRALNNSDIAIQEIENYEELLIELSQQKGLPEDTELFLTLSIHPADFITASESDYFSSCTTLNDMHGDTNFARGLSPETIVAFVHDGTDSLKCDGYAWNNKRWRALLCLNERGFMISKHYPFRNNIFAKLILATIQGLFEEVEEVEDRHFYSHVCAGISDNDDEKEVYSFKGGSLDALHFYETGDHFLLDTGEIVESDGFSDRLVFFTEDIIAYPCDACDYGVSESDFEMLRDETLDSIDEEIDELISQKEEIEEMISHLGMRREAVLRSTYLNEIGCPECGYGH